MKTQIKKKAADKSTVKLANKVNSKATKKNKAGVNAKSNLKPKTSSSVHSKHVSNLKIRLVIEPKMALYQKNGLKIASTKNLAKFRSLCQLTEINPALNAQVVEAIGKSISKNQGFKIDVINSKFNLKTNICNLSLKFNTKKKKQFTVLVGKIFGQKIKNPNQFLFDVDPSIFFTRLSKYLKKMIQAKTRQPVIKSKFAFIELNSMRVTSFKLNGHTVFKKKPKAK